MAAAGGLNGAGAAITGVVVVVLGTKFLRGLGGARCRAGLIVLFARIESYYDEVGQELKLGRTPPLPAGARASSSCRPRPSTC